MTFLWSLVHLCVALLYHDGLTGNGTSTSLATGVDQTLINQSVTRIEETCFDEERQPNTAAYGGNTKRNIKNIILKKYFSKRIHNIQHEMVVVGKDYSL